MYKELLYWEKKFKKRQGRLRILGSRWVVRPFPAPAAPGLAPRRELQGRAGQPAHFGLEGGSEKQKGREVVGAEWGE